MAITIAAYEFTATIGSAETSLTTNTSGPDADTTDGIYQVFIDLNAMTAGDQFTLTAYETVATSGGTQRKAFVATFADAQAVPVWVSPSLVLGVGWDMTLKKDAGTDRSIPWRITKVA